MLEREVAGFGASGRNGGWCSALFPASIGVAREAVRRAAGDRAAPGDAGQRRRGRPGRGGRGHRLPLRPRAAPSRSPARRFSWSAPGPQVAEARRWGFGEQDLALLDRGRGPRAGWTRSDVLGATYTPHCAAIHPARLVRGLARAVERLGVRLHERTPVTRIAPGRVDHSARHGARRRGHPGNRGLHRAAARAAASPRAGLLADGRHRAAARRRLGPGRAARPGDLHRPPPPDRLRPAHRGRPAGVRRPGRAVPLRLRDPARARPGARRVRCAAPACWSTCCRPSRTPRSRTRGADRWASPRDWCASVGLDKATGLGWAGGYVGDGVSTTNLAGRTLADLVLGRDSDLVRLPWVDHRSPLWEPEPLRWLGVSASLAGDDRGRRRGGPHRPPIPTSGADGADAGSLTADLAIRPASAPRAGRTAHRRPADAGSCRPART